MSHPKLSFPIGEYVVPQPIEPGHLKEWTNTIRTYPDQLEAVVNGLNEKQLDTPYRPGGWTVKQLIHHIADSHMNAYIRLKLGMTEVKPTIKPYDQAAWAELADATLPISVSLAIIRGVHLRWATCLDQVEEWKRTIVHPELNQEIPLDELTGMYDWHSRHHLAHIKNLIEWEDW